MTSQSNKDTKWVGGILLIAGTSIGGAMLALPVAAAPSGFISSSLFFFLVWAVMTFCAYLILEVNLWLPTGSNLISMAKATLGRPGELVAWGSYLLLLYALLSAYIAGGSDLFQNLLHLLNVYLPLPIAATVFTGILAFVVYRGISLVDMMNRGLMFGKLGVLVLLLAIITPHVHPQQLQTGQSKAILGSMMVIITSFGFAIVIPSLRAYFKSDVKKLRSAIMVGTLIPLFLYIAWIAVIIGVIPRTGSHGLIAMLHSGHQTSALTTGLQENIHNTWITSFSRVFTSICMLTAFLGVSLCLTDFLADGFKLKKRGKQGFLVFALAFIPPVAIILINPTIFISALSYAGILCVVLLVLLPAVMAWGGRYHKKIATGYEVGGGKLSLLFVIALALSAIIITCLSS